MTRRKSSFRRQNGDEASGLAGWMYTDLLLGLAVVFLGSIGVVVFASSDSSQDPGGETPTAEGEVNGDFESDGISTSSTSSTSTVPIEMCSVLYDPPVDSSDGLQINIPGRPSADEMAREFQTKLTEKLRVINRSLPQGMQQFSFSSIDIALVLTYHGPMPDGSSGNTEAKAIFDGLRRDFPSQFENAVGRHLKRTSGPRSTTIEVFLVYERPCNQTG